MLINSLNYALTDELKLCEIALSSSSTQYDLSLSVSLTHQNNNHNNNSRTCGNAQRAARGPVMRKISHKPFSDFIKIFLYIRRLRNVSARRKMGNNKKITSCEFTWSENLKNFTKK